MKRFLLFGYDHYYPCGGWEDFIGDFDTLGEAKDGINVFRRLGYIRDDYEVVDSDQKRVVWPEQRHGGKGLGQKVVEKAQA